MMNPRHALNETIEILLTTCKQFTWISLMPNQVGYGRIDEDTWEVALPVPEKERYKK